MNSQAPDSALQSRSRIVPSPVPGSPRRYPGYVPVTARRFASEWIGIPAGAHPVVLTFDDSTGGRFVLDATGRPAPGSAVGILLDIAKTHPSFRPVATFFVNGDPFRFPAPHAAAAPPPRGWTNCATKRSGGTPPTVTPRRPPSPRGGRSRCPPPTGRRPGRTDGAGARLALPGSGGPAPPAYRKRTSTGALGDRADAPDVQGPCGTARFATGRRRSSRCGCRAWAGRPSGRVCRRPTARPTSASVRPPRSPGSAAAPRR